MIERYKVSEVDKIWSEENKLKIWLQIEILTIEGWERIGVIKKGIADKIRKRVKKISKEEVEKRERITNHDVAAFVDVLENKVPLELRKYIHYGLTSSDLLDTTISLQMKQTLALVLESLKEFEKIVMDKAIENRNVIIAGRTHGMFAEPITLFHKFSGYLSEVKRNILRVEKAIEEISFGKLSGSVGNYIHIPPEIESYVLGKLGLKPEPISTQIVPRDRHAIFGFILSLIGTMLERIALEIRLLSRTEILEFQEPFGKGQKGSSSMPHKKNPIISERICGMARMLRASVVSLLENIPLWHERDISHSSVERVVLPDISHLTLYMINKMKSVIKGLVIYRENIEKNIKQRENELFSQALLYILLEKGIPRDQAYRMVQKAYLKDQNELNKILKKAGLNIEILKDKFYNKILKNNKIFERRIKRYEGDS